MSYRFSAPRKFLSTFDLMEVSVVQNENLSFTRVFYDIFRTLYKVSVFFRIPKMTHGGELRLPYTFGGVSSLNDIAQSE